ncbi:MAG: hypothetical protein J6Q73_07770 [Bacteroidaceae bacterium]|nr:hypothetical protein [Bacteroidaceae bacterium]
MWGEKKVAQMPTFATRGEAFAYMLQAQLSEGVEAMVAAKKADEFADIFAKNMQLPERVEPKPKGVDSVLATIDKVSVWVDAHPKVVEMIVPTITFVAGLFTAKAAAPPPPPPMQCNESIDFENVK